MTIDFAKFYRQPASGIGLGIFRIIYALILLFEVAQLIYLYPLMFDEVSTLVSSESSLKLCLYAWVGVIFCLIAGYRVRVAAALNYLMTLATFSTFTTFEYHLDLRSSPSTSC